MPYSGDRNDMVIEFVVQNVIADDEAHRTFDRQPVPPTTKVRKFSKRAPLERFPFGLHCPTYRVIASAAKQSIEHRNDMRKTGLLRRKGSSQ
jgi:hypothetical protein